MIRRNPLLTETERSALEKKHTPAIVEPLEIWSIRKKSFVINGQ